MVKSQLVAIIIAIIAIAPAAAVEPLEPPAPRNPLDGYDVSLSLPALIFALEGREARPAWTGEAVLLLDGRPAAQAALPTPTPVVLPRQPWDARDWLRAAGMALGAGAAGYAAGRIVQALR